MFLRTTIRNKHGKAHKYFSIVENKRLADGRIAQRHVLYLGEISECQALAWRQSIEVLEEGQAKPRLLILYHASLSFRPAVDSERSPPAVLLSEMSRYGGQVVVGRDLDVY
jgi:hypothetical protein